MIHNFIREDHQQIRKDVKEMKDFLKQLKDQKSYTAKKYFCWNLLKNKLTIGLWGIPDMSYYNFPVFSFFKCSSYFKFGIRYKRILFEIVWNKNLNYITRLSKRFDRTLKML